MTFRSVFIAVFIGTALVVAAFLLHSLRPAAETDQPSAALARATGKCASCHRQETAAVVAEYETSAHARQGINCLECHQPQPGQQSVDHRGFEIAAQVTAANCAQCHADEYRQFLRSRHAAPAYAAVTGPEPFTPEQVAFAERYHPGAVDRPANALAVLEGPAATQKGCITCHAIGRPNSDGSIGTCTACHARHRASLALARQPETCGQCHMGPDHSQLEIYNESKHGVLFRAGLPGFDLDVAPEELTAEAMPVPTCATCHMSGLGGQAITHDTTERLSWYLFAEISKQRPDYPRGQERMKQICLECHAGTQTDRFFREAEEVLAEVNARVEAGMAVGRELAAEGLLTPAPFDEPLDFVLFDFWHYYGRTAKHGAFMGGADFVQWHGNYELLAHQVEIEHAAAELRGTH